MPAIKDSAAQNAALYEADFVEWADQTAELLKSRRFDEVDTAALVEEIEGLAGSQRNEIESRLAVTIAHLLKWKYQPERRSASWHSTIVVQRVDSQRLLRKCPSLMHHIQGAFEEVYRDGRRIALAETRLATAVIPETPEFSLEQVLDDKFFP